MKNLKYLFVDTETTGKIVDFKNKDITNIANFPRIVQVAYIGTDEQGETLFELDRIVKPNGFEIPIEASNIHGITTEIAHEKGISLESVLYEFLPIINSCETIICHNIPFDLPVLACEYYRIGVTKLPKKQKICTMDTTKEFVGIKNSYGYKWANLQELYHKLFGKNFDKAHNALNDIRATKECFFELKNKHNFYQ